MGKECREGEEENERGGDRDERDMRVDTGLEAEPALMKTGILLICLY